MKRHSYARLAVALLAGALFGFGLSLSGMIDPARVVGFLDIASGNWDPSLMFVLGGALLMALPGVMLLKRRAAPVLDDRFHLPEDRPVDTRLVLGSALFGIGWGLAGFCPGPALSALAIGLPHVVLFVVAMAAGMLLHDRVLARRAT